MAENDAGKSGTVKVRLVRGLRGTQHRRPRPRLDGPGEIRAIGGNPGDRHLGGRCADPGVVRSDERGRGRRCRDRADQRLGSGDASRDRHHPRHEQAAVHAFMREAIVKRDRPPAQLLVHRGQAGCGWAAGGCILACASSSSEVARW